MANRPPGTIAPGQNPPGYLPPTFPGINPDQEMRQCINKSYRAALITSENPELREVDLEPSSKRGCSNK